MIIKNLFLYFKFINNRLSPLSTTIRKKGMKNIQVWDGGRTSLNAIIKNDDVTIKGNNISPIIFLSIK